MKIVTLNIQHGGGKRISPIIAFLKQLNADLIVLTEYRLDDKNLGKQLVELGYKNQIAGNAQSKENSVLIVSKVAFEVLSTSQRIVSVRLNDLVIFGVYFPQGDEKRPIYMKLKDGVMDAGSLVLVLGDFNTGLHYIDEAGKTFACADSFESLKDVGLVDSWRTRHPTTKEFSWFSSQGNGFRIDHVFCSELLEQKVSNIEYIHSPRESKITDHSALVVEVADMGIVYSRYVDDMAMSSIAFLSKEEQSKAIAMVYAMLRIHGLSASRKKHESFSSKRRMIVTKLTVNQKPSLGRAKKLKIRSQVHHAVGLVMKYGAAHPEAKIALDKAAQAAGQMGRFHASAAQSLRDKIRGARKVGA